MSGLYELTNKFNCIAVQFKEGTDFETFREECCDAIDQLNVISGKILEFTMSKYSEKASKYCIMKIELPKDGPKQIISMKVGDYLVKLPLLKNLVVIDKNTFENMFKKVED